MWSTSVQFTLTFTALWFTNHGNAALPSFTRDVASSASSSASLIFPASSSISTPSSPHLSQDATLSFQGAWKTQHARLLHGQPGGHFDLTLRFSSEPSSPSLVRHAVGELVLRQGSTTGVVGKTLHPTIVDIVAGTATNGGENIVLHAGAELRPHHMPFLMPHTQTRPIQRAASSARDHEHGAATSGFLLPSEKVDDDGGGREADDDGDDDERIGNDPRGFESNRCKFALSFEFQNNLLLHWQSSEDVMALERFTRAVGALSSPACGIAIELQAQRMYQRPNASTKRTHPLSFEYDGETKNENIIDQETSRATRYGLGLVVMALIHISLTLRQAAALQASPALLSRVSSFGIGCQAVVDGALCLVHLTVAVMSEHLFAVFSLVAILYFILFGVLEMRLMLAAWRARWRPGTDPWTVQRELPGVLSRFYAALLATILLSYHVLRYAPPVLLLGVMFWLPHILLAAREQFAPPLQPTYVMITSLLRLVLPLYGFGCADNLFGIKQSIPMCVAAVVLMASQAVLLLSQAAWGPRWFVPGSLLPERYDYFRLPPGRCGKSGAYVMDIESGEAYECPICMGVVDIDGMPTVNIMTTPCGHVFHRVCLERWMFVKRECPTCRAYLP